MVIAAICTISGASPAAGSQASPPPDLAFMDARVTRAALVELAPEARFVLLTFADPTSAPPWDAHAEIHDYRVATGPAQCQQLYATVAIEREVDRSAVAALVGQSFTVATLAPDAASEWCEVLAGHAALWPGGARFGDRAWQVYAESRRDEILPALQAVRDAFAPGEAAVTTPLDGAVTGALGALDSRAAFGFALTHRLYFFAARHFKWRHDPALFPESSADLLTRPWPDSLPAGSQVELFWQLSPARAQAAVRELATKDARRAGILLMVSPARAEALAVFRGLYEAGTLPAYRPPRDAAHTGVHDDLMQQALAGNVDEREAADLREALALTTTRAALGVTDGLSLARHLAGRPDDDDAGRPFVGMQVRLVGPGDGCCDVRVPLGDATTLDVAVDCDAESFRRTCDRADRHGHLDVVGNVASTRVRTREQDGRPHTFVELELVAATATPVDAAPTSAPTPAEPPAAAPTSNGCGCDLDTPDALTTWLLVGLLALRRRAR